MNRFAGIAVLFLLTSIFSSCSFYKVVSGKRTKDPDKKVVWTGADTSHTTAVLPAAAMPLTDTATTPIANKTVNPLIGQFTPVWEKRLVYKTFSGKAKMQFEGPDNKVEFTGHFRVKKDSAIWINITALGGMVQAVRIFITPDSFFMINIQQKQYTRLPLNQADKFLPAKVDFSSLQNLVLGEPIREGIITDASNLGDSLILQVEDSSYLQRIVYNASDSTMRTGHLRTRKPNGPQALTEYNAYVNSGNGKISSGRVINLLNGNDTFTLYMNFSKIDFDIPLDMPFSIPANYTLTQ